MAIAKADSRTLHLEAIKEADIARVAEFFHRGLSSGASPADWRATMRVPWQVDQPNHGYLLRENGRVVGAYHAFYSERVIDGRPHRICNLGAWSVAEEHRAAGLRMVRSLLRQRGYTFTDLTPSGNVLALNARLGFESLDTTTAVVANLPWPLRSRGVRVTDREDEVDDLLSGPEQKIYRDHATSIAHHVVLTRGGRTCYVMYRRQTHRHLPLFASILYVSDPDLFRGWAPYFYRHLLKRGVVATLVELRLIGHRPPRSVTVAGPPKMYLSEDLAPERIDYLYSELTCRKW